MEDIPQAVVDLHETTVIDHVVLATEIVVERVHVIGIGVGFVQIIGIGVATGRNHVNETEVAEGVREVALVIMNVVVERKNIRRIVRRVRREVIRVNTPKVVRGL